jgi:MFS family permease
MYPVQAVKTLALFTSIFAIGLTFGVIGPTLLDLRIQVSRDLSETSTALPARAAGYAIGSFIMGFVYDRLNIMLFTTVSMGCATVLTALIPHMHIFYWMLAVFFLNGVCLGSFEAACNMMLLHIWGKGWY